MASIKTARDKVQPGINTPQDGGAVGERLQNEGEATKTVSDV